MVDKKSKGRKKIEMKQLEGNGRSVTFTKRRNGLFKKAAQLSTLCGVKMAIIIFSTVGKTFTFGSPNLEEVLDRFLKKKNDPMECNNTTSVATPGDDLRIISYYEKLDEFNQRHLDEKAREKRLTHVLNTFYKYVDELDVNGLRQLILNIEILQNQAVNVGIDTQKSTSQELDLFTFKKPKEEEKSNAIFEIPSDWLKV